MLHRLRMQVLAWAIFAPLAIAGHPALAAQTVQISRTVAYEDLNLAHPKGMATLERRISRALGQVCDVGSRTLSERVEQQRCLTGAREHVSPQVGRALAEARRGVPAPQNLAAIR